MARNILSVANLCLFLCFFALIDITYQKQKVESGTEEPLYFECMKSSLDFPTKDLKIWKPFEIYPMNIQRSVANIGDYPFMVSIVIMNKTHCAGVLYDADMVTTTAACLQLFYNNRYYRENPRALKIRYGSNHSRYGGGVEYGTEIFFHPDYNPKTLEYNVAAIRLYNKVVLGRSNPRCLELYPKKQAVAKNVKILILKWGDNMVNSAYEVSTGFLQKQVSTVYANYNCKNRYGEKYVPDSTFCVGSITERDGLCNHDSGSAAILDGQLVGLASSGSALCQDYNSPTIFTHIGYVSEWLNRVAMSRPRFTTPVPTEEPTTSIGDEATTGEAAESTTLPVE